MDLSKLSTADLQALQSGDLSKVSVAGLRSLQTGASQAEPRYNPTDGMSGTEKFLAGAGKAFVDAGRGIGQLVGLVSGQDVAEARQRDAALMDTGAGLAGNVVGNLAVTAPTVAIPAAATVKGAAAIGAGLGLVQPAADLADRAVNVGLGGAAGPVGLAAGRALGGAWEGAKAIAAPITPGGRERIVGSTLQRFSDDPAAAAQALRGPIGGRSLVPGSLPTTAEASGDVGLAQLQRSVQSGDPALNSRFTERAASNQRARVAALDDIAGDDVKREAADAARRTNAQALYDKAFGQVLDPAALTPAQQTTVDELLKRPAMQRAIAKGRELAAESGIEIPQDGSGSIRALHYAKMALDDDIASLGPGGIGPTQQRAMMATRDKLLGWLDEVSPDYGAARRQYAEDSLPINRMDVGQRLRDTLKPPLADITPSGMGERINDFARVMRDPDALARKATGRNGSRMEDILTEDQMRTVRAVASDAAQAADTNRGKAIGSNTVQNLTGQNLVQKLSSSTGLPTGLWDVGGGLPRMLRFALSGREADVQDLLANALLDPQQGRRMLELALTPGMLQRLGRRLEPGLPALGSAGAATYPNQ